MSIFKINTRIRKWWEKRRENKTEDIEPEIETAENPQGIKYPILYCRKGELADGLCPPVIVIWHRAITAEEAKSHYEEGICIDEEKGRWIG